MEAGIRGTTERAATRRRRIGGHTSAAATAPAPSSAVPAQPASLWHLFSARLTPHEWRRRAVHMSPGLLP
ncbi:MAG TPA: hypothetical protein VKU82_10795, partial [Planctomycetaceae bacterium]|nr:hypothetical protein [Planctomycetaceae bacterium]